MIDIYRDFINKLKKDDLYRELSTKENIIDFANNDYLALSNNQEVIKSANDAANLYGVGSKASRLVSGNLTIHQELEKIVAETKNKESALIFNSGFQTNSTVLASFLDKKVLGTTPLVFTDKLNHASIHHACKLAGVKQIRYRHLDMEHLEKLLDKYKNDSSPKFIITETVFGMDGDVVDIQHLTDLAKCYKAFLYVDEAHAVGLFGKKGYGISEGYEDKIDVIMGTFSKAIGVSGGYIACSKILKDYIVNKCNGFIYSTASSPILSAAALTAWKIIPKLRTQTQNLHYQSDNLKNKLKSLGFNVGNSTTNIIPLIIGDNNKVLSIQKNLLTSKIYVAAIRHPSVPANQARIRIALTLNHTQSDINKLLAELGKFK